LPAAAASRNYPLANKFDEVDFLMVLDDGARALGGRFFYRHTRAAQYIRSSLHRYSAFPYVLRILYMADMMIGAAMWNAQQTGLDKLQAVREKLADLVCYREGINAHLTAAVAMAQKSPGGLLMPHQSLLYAGRIHACSNLPQMMHIARELCGGQICVTPNEAAFRAGGSRQWLEKFYNLNDKIGTPTIGASCSPSHATCSTPTMRATASPSCSSRRRPTSTTFNALYQSFDFSGPLELRASRRRPVRSCERTVCDGRGSVRTIERRLKEYRCGTSAPAQVQYARRLSRSETRQRSVHGWCARNNHRLFARQTAMDLDGNIVGVGDPAAANGKRHGVREELCSKKQGRSSRTSSRSRSTSPTAPIASRFIKSSASGSRAVYRCRRD